MRMYIKITYPINEPDNFSIDTNVKEGYVSDLLTDWVHDQIGKGKDNQQANEQEVYHIEIQVDLSHDIFYLNSDTGNDGLTTGIIMDVLRRM